MKKIYTLFTIFSICILTGCKTINDNNTMSYGASYNPKAVLQIKRDTFNINQMDSMTTTDKLPSIKKWKSSVMNDAETNVSYVYYTLFNNNIIYTVKNINNKYVVIKKKIN